MEISFFTESYLPTRDGVANETAALALALTRLGHGVRVYAPDPGVPVAPTTGEAAKIPVVRLASVPVPLYPEYRWTVFPFPRLMAESAGRDADVVHLHTPGILGSAGFLAGRRFRKPIVGTFHTNVWAMRDSFPPTLSVKLFFRAAWWYTLGTYWRCDAATAPTAEARQALETHAKKPWRRRIEVVPNGIEVERFHPGIAVPDWRERCGLPELPLVTYLGRLTQDKGVLRFLDAVSDASANQEFVAIVGGRGPEEEAVRARIRRDPVLARRVRFVGPVAEEEKAALLAQTDLFVLPSTSDTSSIALLEAMASGAACVASNLGGPKEILRDRETGRLVSVLEPGRLAQAIALLLDEPGERRRLAREAREFVQRHASIEATARRFISLYELLLDERRS
ncbi:MAG: glycosyltransferase [Thermoplasmata archaeon]|nr:glycosyltransferase [Thermoplasmata archaeon]MCI4359054.1 glycosyltransferase [Thermoplasmata archaeon]